MYISVVISPGFDFVFSVLVKRLAGKSISEMTYFVSSGMYYLNSINLLGIIVSGFFSPDALYVTQPLVSKQQGVLKNSKH